MSTNNCGCNTTTTPSKKMLLVEATPSEQDLCGSGLVTSGTEACPLQENKYDKILSSFVLPTNEGEIAITVCNGSVYELNQWIQFVNPLISMKIIAINENIITLVNRCNDGSVIPSNPEAGLVVTKNSIFIVSSAPACDSDEVWSDRIAETIEDFTAICIPDLLESGNRAVLQVVGLIQSNPDNTSERRCIKKIFGFLMNAGTPILAAIKKTTSTQKNDFRRLGISKTTREVKELPNYSEDTTLANNKQYGIGFDKTKEYPVGPCMFPSLFNDKVKEVGSINTLPASYVTINDTTYTTTINLSANTNITDRLRRDQDYYVMFHMVMGITSPYFVRATVKVNGFVTGIMFNADGSGVKAFHVYLPVLINKDDEEITIEVTGSAQITGIALTVTLLGGYF